MRKIEINPFYTGKQEDCGIWMKQCTVCMAINYEDSREQKGEKSKYKEVNKINQISFARNVICLCDDCAKDLANLIEQNVN